MGALTDDEPTVDLGPWRGHLVLTAWLAVVVIVGLVRARDVDELWVAFVEGEPRTQLEAAAALAQRASTEALAERFPSALLESDDARLRELAFTSLFTRRPETRLGEAELRLVDAATRPRATFWWRNRMTTPGRVTLEDLDRWFAAPPE